MGGEGGGGGDRGEEASKLKNVGILLRVKLLFLALSTGNSLELMTSPSQASDLRLQRGLDGNGHRKS